MARNGKVNTKDRIEAIREHSKNSKNFKDTFTFSSFFAQVPEHLRDTLPPEDVAAIMDALYDAYRSGYRQQSEDKAKRPETESRTRRAAARPVVEDPLAGAAALTGSDKQVAWANDLRAKAIAWSKESLAKLDDAEYDHLDEETKDGIRERGAKVIALLLAETSARTIIDHRDNLLAYYKRLAQPTEE